MIGFNIILAISLSGWADDAATVSAARTDDDGCLVHVVRSPYQAGETQIRALLPEKIVADQRYSVIYVLPVEASRERRYGDGLQEIKERGLHRSQPAIYIAPTFSHLPWYADHPTDLARRQESYLLKVVIPFVEKTYPAAANAKGRLLLGFSKSGWGAWCLLLRHPDLFGRAAAWDAPLMMDWPSKYGSQEIFGTSENFAQYQLTRLLRAKPELGDDASRLILLGRGNFQAELEQSHKLLDELKIPHTHRDGTQRKHDWHSGWVAEAVELLLAER